MSREKLLVKNTAIVAVGQIGTKFMSFFLLPIYTSQLSSLEYGVVDLLNTYVSLLLPLIFLQLDQAIFRFLIDVRESSKEKSSIISSVFFTVLCISLIYFILYYFLSLFLFNSPYKIFLGTNVITAMFASVSLQISRGLGKNNVYSMGSLVSGSVTIILNLLLIVVFHCGAYGMLIATLTANILTTIYIFFRLKIYKYIRISNFSADQLRVILNYSIPLVPNALSWWIINASDRTIISHFIGVSMNGVYSASNKFSSIIITLFSIFNMTWAESASMYVNDEDSSDYFSNIINISFRLFSSICLIVISLMPFVFKYLIPGASFSLAYYQIPILMLATLFNIIVSLLGSIYIALKKSNEIAKTSVYAAVINILLNFIFIKYIGLYAASISTLIAYFAMSIYRFCDVQKYVKLKMDLSFIIIYSLMAIITMYVYYLQNRIICLIVLILQIIIGYIFNMKIIFRLYKLLKQRQ